MEFIVLKLTDVIVIGLLSGFITFIGIGLFVSGLRKYKMIVNWEYNITRYIYCVGAMSFIKLISGNTGISVRVSVAVLLFGLLLSITGYMYNIINRKV